MHQLRVHCEALGFGIQGDPKYGREQADPDGFAERVHLHARALRLPHPKGGRLEVAAELPPRIIYLSFTLAMEDLRLQGEAARP